MGASLFIPWFKLTALEVPLGWIPMLSEDTVLPIQPFGVLVAIGVLFGARMGERFAEKEGWDPAIMADFTLHLLLTAFVASYVLNGVFYHPDTMREVLADPMKLTTEWLGLSSFGGFLGGVLGLFFWKWRRKLPALRLADAAAFAFPFGWLFGRSGCFSVHDHPGRVTDFALAVADYEFGRPPYQPRHDLGFYEVLFAAAMIVLFLWMHRQKRRPGTFLAVLCLVYAPIRFGLDYLRASPAEGGDARYSGLTPGQYAAVALFVAGAAFLYFIMHHEAAMLPAKALMFADDEGDGDEPGGDDDDAKDQKQSTDADA